MAHYDLAFAPPADKWKRKEFRLRLSGHVEDQIVTQELAFRGDLNGVDLRKQLHDALDRMIFSALAAERKA